MRERFIIHLNVADFASAVERIVDPRLQGRPLLISQEGASRAVVYDMSDEAYRSGVRKKMPLRTALRRCPDATLLPPRPDRYERAMTDLLKHALPYSPLIEVADTQGHLFLDVTGTGRLFGPPPDLAWRIRKSVRSAMGLDPIWSVAPNKLVAKVATRVVKPMGEYIIGAGEEASFLAPLPLHLIPGIESDDLRHFVDFNLTHVRDAARLSEEQLAVLFGSKGKALHEALHGIDPSPVFSFTQSPPLMTADHIFGDDANDVSIVKRALFQLVERAGTRLRRQRLAAGRIRIRIDYSDGIRAVRQAVIDPPSANDLFLYPLIESLLNQAWKRRVRIRRLALTCDRLAYPPPVQQTLFDEEHPQKAAHAPLTATLDAIRDRFGHGAVQTGRVLAA